LYELALTERISSVRLHLSLYGIGCILSFFTATFDILARTVNGVASHRGQSPSERKG
jgi:hypothetical protein